jgi:NAD(P)-dependent dehydrogenase (short-subunit alcohol dehydrogenase family)
MTTHTDGGRRVLITGGGSGLGAALARRFVAAGDRVLVTDLAERLASTPDAPGSAVYRRLDVRRGEDWAAARDWVDATWGGLDVLVNNAGIATGGRIDVAPIAEWQGALDTNLLGVARGCHVFAPDMRDQRSGHIVNIASMAGLVHPAMMSSYNAAKAGVVALSETLSYELEPYGIDVTVVCPSFFRSGLATSMQGADRAAVAAGRRRIRHSTMGADDVADQVMAAIARHRFLVITDRRAHMVYLLKRLARPLYDRAMTRHSRRSANARARARR